jgi:NAD(P)-dependent dehydrogenase (short-subunit alcohol dehydrogenase family)
MTDRLAGKVALVSGGARGMGASHVRSLVAEGAKEVGEATRYVHLDVTQPLDWERAVGIHPGLIKTPMTEWVPEDIFQTALGRAAEPVEVSNLVVYLASDESSYSTGSEFIVDGASRVSVTRTSRR